MANAEDIKYTPWRVRDPTERSSESVPGHIPDVEISIDTDLAPEQPQPAPAGDPIPRRLYLTKAILEKYGVTEGCLGCTNALLGNQGVPHSEECRHRITEMMMADPTDEAKVKEASRRRKEFVSKHQLQEREQTEPGANVRDGEPGRTSPEHAGS